MIPCICTIDSQSLCAAFSDVGPEATHQYLVQELLVVMRRRNLISSPLALAVTPIRRPCSKSSRGTVGLFDFDKHEQPPEPSTKRLVVRESRGSAPQKLLARSFPGLLPPDSPRSKQQAAVSEAASGCALAPAAQRRPKQLLVASRSASVALL